MSRELEEKRWDPFVPIRELLCRSPFASFEASTHPPTRTTISGRSFDSRGGPLTPVDFVNYLVTAIGSFAGDTVIASLKRRQVNRVIGCDIHPASWIPTSSSVDAFYRVPLAADARRYVDALIDVIKKETIDYI